jgi:RNA polymerase sigma-70 factor (ECF subfamily)
MSDQEIIRLYREGYHERAFNEIVKLYSERLYWHVRSFVCSHDDADDLLQEIFIKVWASLPTYRGDAQLFTWIYRIATNEALNYLHKQKIRATLSLESLSGVMEKKIDEDAYFNGNEAQRMLSKAIQKLPEKQRTVFIMRYYENMKYEEISEVLKTSEGSLKASYHIAFEKIKAELKKITD